MNVVTDLAARAVSFISLIQDTILKGSLTTNVDNKKLNLAVIFQTDFKENIKEYIKACNENAEYFEKRAIELVWISEKTSDGTKAQEYTTKLAVSLVKWVCKNEKKICERLGSSDDFPTPYEWRDAISEVLYSDPEQRVALATQLQYLPIQIILALGGGAYSAHKQRILQVWKMDWEDQKALMTSDERQLLKKFYDVSDKDAESLLRCDEKLLKELINKDSPLPFELVFKQELKEISENRALRCKEQCLTGSDHVNKDESNPAQQTDDPFKKAKSMKLLALALSGGGIRSATFNLGILQGLAKKGLISKFDYLSTVSGGGYIGSWLAAWIKRAGAVTKVNDRLSPDKSPDPFGEEVRSIRWLRMFSNYFTPQASIMSVDSWTVGITWLRNTLLNQVIILILFLATLLGIRFFYEIWRVIMLSVGSTATAHLYIWSIILMLPVALLAGFGMQAYQNEQFPPVVLKKHKTRLVSIIILSILFGGTFIISAWLFSIAAPANNPSHLSFPNKLLALIPAAVVCFTALILVAIFGRYDKCLKAAYINISEIGKNIKAWWDIFYTAALSALVGLLCLGLVWTLFETIKFQSFKILPGKTMYILFIIGSPLVMEIFGIVVVARMALLGKYFPDERREWWGRIGAVVHRFAFIYILIAGCSLIGRDMMSIIAENLSTLQKTSIAGGWLALVISAVKAAFSAKTSGKDGKGFVANLFELLAKIGPYLFAVGLLVFLPALLIPFEGLSSDIDYPYIDDKYHSIIDNFILMAILFIIAYYLARRVGVNEFSMHHFYRNRLVRAYLGATRRRIERQMTANPFTGFDMGDDVKLSELQNQHGYYGPYPILNTALNASQVTNLDRQDRKAESFIFSPLYCGFDFSMTRASTEVATKSYDYGYRQTVEFAYPDGPSIGTAMAISGAAVNPNQGYHSSTATAFLLTVFNVQMGWWIGNPRKSTWREADPRFGLGYIIHNLMGRTNTRNDFVCLSDGGHFDNMGLYELIRRRCSFIILGDGEQDTNFTCEGLANAIRRCRVDFGAEIDINVDDITNRDENKFSKKHYVTGKIKYAGDPEPGMLLYIKSSITGNEPVDIREYSKKNKTFPHQSTADQFFDEEQFESYRKLGLHIADVVLSDPEIAKALDIEVSNVSKNGNVTENFRSQLNSFLYKTRIFLGNRDGH
jgi:hypothetical protein